MHWPLTNIVIQIPTQMWYEYLRCLEILNFLASHSLICNSFWTLTVASKVCFMCGFLCLAEGVYCLPFLFCPRGLFYHIDMWFHNEENLSKDCWLLGPDWYWMSQYQLENYEFSDPWHYFFHRVLRSAVILKANVSGSFTEIPPINEARNWNISILSRKFEAFFDSISRCVLWADLSGILFFSILLSPSLCSDNIMHRDM